MFFEREFNPLRCFLSTFFEPPPVPSYEIASFSHLCGTWPAVRININVIVEGRTCSLFKATLRNSNFFGVLRSGPVFLLLAHLNLQQAVVSKQGQQNSKE